MPTQQAQIKATGDMQVELEAVRGNFNSFVYTVSHDFGTPLRAVVSFSSLLHKDYGHLLDEKGKRYLEFITGGGEKAQAMMQGLLQYSRLYTRLKPPEVVDVPRLVDGCIAALKEKIAKNNARILVDGVLPHVMAERDQMFQLFMALLDNAITYYVDGLRPQVTISVEEQQAHWKFMIEDNGIGIPPEQIQRIFELFRRLHTDSEYPGVGMGLTIAKRIVEYHGGCIGVQSAASGGSVFWFTISRSNQES